VYTNIVCAAPYTIDEAWDAARLAGLESDLRLMPMGMHTIIGDGGAGLSGGQRQRLMVARAIVGRPRILLFDEATSALDNQTQAIVSRSLENLKATRVVIAHRLSTIINADKIVVIEHGTVVQTGTYAELVARPGLFAELAKRQMV
jgi:ATP-binding cassette subfamily C protein